MHQGDPMQRVHGIQNTVPADPALPCLQYFHSPTRTYKSTPMLGECLGTDCVQNCSFNWINQVFLEYKKYKTGNFAI